MTNRAGQRTWQGVARYHGTSRGPGSRLRLYHCLCTPVKELGITNKARVASDHWHATCKRCSADYVLQSEQVIVNPALAINVPGLESEA